MLLLFSSIFSPWLNLERIMMKFLPLSLVILCIIIGETSLGYPESDFRSVDLFEALKIRPQIRVLSVDYVAEREVERLNNYLIDNTDSNDAEENLDLILEQLILDYKNKLDPHGDRIKIKRLLMALTTIKGENSCNYYSYLILGQALDATKCRFRLLNGRRKRIDKVVGHYIYKHANNCLPIYLKNYDNLSKNLDEILMKRLDALLGPTIQNLILYYGNPHIKGDTYEERLKHMASERVGRTFDMSSKYIYDIMMELTKDDPNKKLLEIFEDERTGRLVIREDKLAELLEEYIIKPCRYFREYYQRDIFKPLLQDNIFVHTQTDRIDFYEAWFKYDLCSNVLDIKRNLQTFVGYAMKQKNTER